MLVLREQADLLIHSHSPIHTSGDERTIYTPLCTLPHFSAHTFTHRHLSQGSGKTAETNWNPSCLFPLALNRWPIKFCLEKTSMEVIYGWKCALIKTVFSNPWCLKDQVTLIPLQMESIKYSFTSKRLLCVRSPIEMMGSNSVHSGADFMIRKLSQSQLQSREKSAAIVVATCSCNHCSRTT